MCCDCLVGGELRDPYRSRLLSLCPGYGASVYVVWGEYIPVRWVVHGVACRPSIPYFDMPTKLGSMKVSPSYCARILSKSNTG
jgi:hypothetical protein